MVSDSSSKVIGWFLVMVAAFVETYAERDNYEILRKFVEDQDEGALLKIIQNGADPNVADPSSGLTPLMVAARLNYPKIVRLLVEHGALTEKKDDEGWCALHHAAAKNSRMSARELLHRRARLNCNNTKGGSPLMIATKFRAPDVAKLLIIYGAHVNDKNNKGYTALMVAANYGATDISRKLIDKGADIEAEEDIDGAFPLTIAIVQDHYNVFNLLIKSGANLNKKAKYGATPLMIAASYNRPEHAEVLIQKGADLNDQDEEGMTALHYAAYFDSPKVAEMLIQNGAEIDIKDTEGNTAFEIARSKQHNDIAALLEEEQPWSQEVTDHPSFRRKKTKQKEVQPWSQEVTDHPSFRREKTKQKEVQSWSQEVTDHPSFRREKTKQKEVQLGSQEVTDHPSFRREKIKQKDVKPKKRTKQKDGCGLPSAECKFPFTWNGKTYEHCGDLDGNGDDCSCISKAPPGSYEGVVQVHKCKSWDKYCEDDEYKDFDYSKFHSHHSVIFPRRPECQIKASGVTDEEKHFIVKHHNEKRSKVAAGEEQHSTSGSSQPKAANMKELTWNDELAYIAQKWADVCIYNHETVHPPIDKAYKKTMMCSRSYSVGQNMYWEMYSDNTKDAWTRAINLWYDEVKDVPVKSISNYDLSSGKLLKKTGHYTQIVWGNTYEVGCGAVSYDGGGALVEGSDHFTEGRILICNYGPAGNNPGSEVYKIGSTASKCGKPGRSKTYPNLCASTDFFED